MLVDSLDKLARGSRGEILAVADNMNEAHRLRRMGLREGVVVEVMSSLAHDPVMIRFDGCQLGVKRTLLQGVTICRCGCEKEDAKSQATPALSSPSVGERRRAKTQAKLDAV